MKLHVSRFDPAADAAARFETFDLAVEGPISVLQALRRIYQELDSSLAFRNADCRRGVCGVCSLSIDGRRVLACMHLAVDGMRIAPPPRRHVFRDLVFDIEGGA